MNEGYGGFFGVWLVLSLIVGAVAYSVTRSGGTAVKCFLLGYVIGIVIYRIVRYGERAHREREDQGNEGKDR